MRVFLPELFIKRLKGRLPRERGHDWVRGKSTEECFDDLRRITGMDFGTDVDAWERWWVEERKRLDIDPDF
jgi:hypothetical protein